MRIAPLPQRLAVNRFVTDEEESHIVVDADRARATGTAKRLVAVCPAGVYTLAPDGSLEAEYAACLECGTCLAVADPGTLTWRYPRGGFGVQYRDG